MATRPRTTVRKHATQDRSRATVDAILTATARVLVRDGFDHATTNRIAEEAGVSVGSIYQYFPNKEALVAALVERHMAEMGAIVEEAMMRVMDAPLEEAVREMVAVMLRAHGVDPPLHKVMLEQVPRVRRVQVPQGIASVKGEQHAGWLRTAAQGGQTDSVSAC